jgi:hypothetical protein
LTAAQRALIVTTAASVGISINAGFGAVLGLRPTSDGTGSPLSLGNSDVTSFVQGQVSTAVDTLYDTYPDLLEHDWTAAEAEQLAEDAVDVFAAALGISPPLIEFGSVPDGQVMTIIPGDGPYEPGTLVLSSDLLNTAADDPVAFLATVFRATTYLYQDQMLADIYQEQLPPDAFSGGVAEFQLAALIGVDQQYAQGYPDHYPQGSALLWSETHANLVETSFSNLLFAHFELEGEE